MLLDLGVNMEHFKDAERGFSINTDAPLDMRFDRTNALSAKEIINTYPSEKLEKILTAYGDFSLKTAQYLTKGIIEARGKHPIETTGQLKAMLHTLHCNQRKVAVIFQTLRIETNKELEQLEMFLKNFSKQIRLKGRCAIITYHSIEDRIVKNAFKTLAEN
jgi:16S rRNA (cytosine1402-N4)-methyltransferase